MRMTPERWDATTDYLTAVFGREDEQLRTLMPRAVEAGLPDIAVDAAVGRFLMLLMQIAGARTGIEVGTLGGYSAIWLARGLAAGGTLHTIESEPKHAAFARSEFEAAGVAGRVELHEGAGLDVLPELAERLGPGSVDALFLDAVKPEYPEYLRAGMPTLRPGALVIADNALGGGGWWIDDPEGASESRDAMDAFNRALAADERFETACVPIREGVLIARYAGG